MRFFRSIIRSAEQIINGNVEQIGKFHKVFEAWFCVAFFITDIRRLRYAQTLCNLTLSESVEFSLLDKSLLKPFHTLYY